MPAIRIIRVDRNGDEPAYTDAFDVKLPADFTGGVMSYLRSVAADYLSVLLQSMRGHPEIPFTISDFMGIPDKFLADRGVYPITHYDGIETVTMDMDDTMATMHETRQAPFPDRPEVELAERIDRIIRYAETVSFKTRGCACEDLAAALTRHCLRTAGQIAESLSDNAGDADLDSFSKIACMQSLVSEVMYLAEVQALRRLYDMLGYTSSPELHVRIMRAASALEHHLYGHCDMRGSAVAKTKDRLKSIRDMLSDARVKDRVNEARIRTAIDYVQCRLDMLSN